MLSGFELYSRWVPLTFGSLILGGWYINQNSEWTKGHQ